MPGDSQSGLDWWQLALFLPSLLALFFLLSRGFEKEGPEPAPALWTVIDLFAVIVIHWVSGMLLGKMLDIPLFPRRLALGIQLILMDIITSAAVLFIAWRTPEPDRSLGLQGPRRSRNLVSVVATLAVFLIPLSVVAWAWLLCLRVLGLPTDAQVVVQIYVRGRASGEWAGMATIALGAVVAAPVMEELFFRGFIFGMLRSWLGRRGAVLLTSAAFAAFHVLPVVILPIFLVGLVLNWIYLKTGSLAYPILFHALFNGTNLVFMSWQT
jgi:membrane protease YdiL (CAAX protease family)